MKLNLKTIKHYFTHGLGTGVFIAPAPVRAIEIVGHHKERGAEQVGVITKEMFTDTPHKQIKQYCELLRLRLQERPYTGGHFIVRTYGDVYTATLQVPKS